MPSRGSTGFPCAELPGLKGEGQCQLPRSLRFGTELPTGLEDAIIQGIAKASKTVHGLKSAWV